MFTQFSRMAETLVDHALNSRHQAGGLIAVLQRVGTAWSNRPAAPTFPQVTSLVANRIRSRLRIVRATSMPDAADRDGQSGHSRGIRTRTEPGCYVSPLVPTPAGRSFRRLLVQGSRSTAAQ